MRLRSVHLIDFKRFDDLTIDLGEAPARVIALVGPNGCGKSSIFDAFEEKNKDIKGSRGAEQPSFFGKSFFDPDPAIRTTTYDRQKSIQLVRADGKGEWSPQSFHIRTAYRYTPSSRIDAIQKQPPMLDDQDRPRSSIATDTRFLGNYARLQGTFLEEVEESDKSGKAVKADLVDRINKSLSKVLDIKISNLGNVTRGQGQLYFEKEGSKDFPYENLSAGEKEVVDLIVDFFVKTSEFKDTVFCIDEPELHLNTAIQRSLLLELVGFVPDSCQLWVATHSIGFLRALQEELKDDSQIIDFTVGDLFKGTHVVTPMRRSRDNWLRVFKTALEDITGLLAPNRIIYCEGRPDPKRNGDERGLDARVYNRIFTESFSDVLFVSSGGGDVEQNAALALKIISKAFGRVELFLLKDRDDSTEEERSEFLKEAMNRMLMRRELENYLYDKEIVARCAAEGGVAFDESAYAAVVTDVRAQDLKKAPVPETIQRLCGSKLSAESLKLHLASFVTPDTTIYSELKTCIFN